MQSRDFTYIKLLILIKLHMNTILIVEIKVENPRSKSTECIKSLCLNETNVKEYFVNIDRDIYVICLRGQFKFNLSLVRTEISHNYCLKNINIFIYYINMLDFDTRLIFKISAEYAFILKVGRS